MREQTPSFAGVCTAQAVTLNENEILQYFVLPAYKPSMVEKVSHLR